MSELICDIYDDISDFDELLEAAEQNAESSWEMNFVSDMRMRYEQYGERMYLSDKQIGALEGIANL